METNGVLVGERVDVARRRFQRDAATQGLGRIDAALAVLTRAAGMGDDRVPVGPFPGT